MDEVERILIDIHPFIFAVKIHSDILRDFDAERVSMWKILYGIYVIEDMKLADIGSISLRKLERVVSYADYVTYHIVVGEACVRMVKSAFPTLGLIGVAEMSVADSITHSDGYIDSALSHARKSTLVGADGFVIQRGGLERMRRRTDVAWVPTFSPGICIGATRDSPPIQDTTTHNTLAQLSHSDLGEFWIVGRGIYTHGAPAETAEQYRALGWDYFLNFDTPLHP